MHGDARFAKPRFPLSEPPASPGSLIRRVLMALVGLGCILVLSCRLPAESELVQLAPSLSPELAAHLAQDSPEQFLSYASRLSPTALSAATTALLTSLPDSLLDFEARERTVLPYLRTLTTTLRDGFRLGYPGRALDAYERRPVVERLNCVRLLRAQVAVGRDKTLGVAERAARYEAIIREAAPYRDVLSLGGMVSSLSELLPRLNRRSEMVENLAAGSEYALAFGDTALACQLLGTLGTFYAQDGDETTMKRWWDRALELARANQNWHEARILSFYASYYRDRGDPARAVALLGQAADRCRELKADEAEIRFLFARLSMFADLSCWDIVDRGLSRADVVMRAGEGKWQASERALWAARLLAIRMRLAVARGEDDDAIRGTRGIVALLAERPPGPERERLYLAAAEALARCDHSVEAAAILAQIRGNCENFGIPELLPAICLLEAELRLEAGDLAGVEASLSRFAGDEEPDPGASETWIQHDLLTTRLAWRRQDRPAALRTLATALAGLETRCAVLGNSPEAFLKLSRFQGLRSLFHEIVVDDAAAGYRFESGWSDLHFRGPVADSSSSPSSNVRAILSGHPIQLLSLPPTVVHVVYSWGERDVVRWFRTGDLVRRDVVSTDPAELRARVDRVHSRFAASPGSKTADDPALASELNALARLLLPGDLLEPGDHRTVLLNRDGPLARMPFEALSLDATVYRPLLLTRDVAYVNSSSESTVEAHPGPRGRALVITDPAYDNSLARRWSTLNEALPGCVNEALQFAESNPGSRLLMGSEASRAAVMSCWETAAEIYLAAHVVRDPELSYQVHIPLAGDSVASGLLTTGDIETADLSRCALVVLSGCGTGVRYAAGNADSPSLADMFVKAGARAVVQTAWNVRDADGAAVMHLFNDRHAARPEDPVHALCEAKRELIRRGADPSIWSAYSIQVATLSSIRSQSDGVETVWNLSR